MQCKTPTVHKVLCDPLSPLSAMIQPANSKYPGTIVKGEDPRRYKVIVLLYCSIVPVREPYYLATEELGLPFRVFDSRKDLICG